MRNGSISCTVRCCSTISAKCERNTYSHKQPPVCILTETTAAVFWVSVNRQHMLLKVSVNCQHMLSFQLRWKQPLVVISISMKPDECFWYTKNQGRILYKDNESAPYGALRLADKVSPTDRKRRRCSILNASQILLFSTSVKPGNAGLYAFHIFLICHSFIFRYLKWISAFGKESDSKAINRSVKLS